MKPQLKAALIGGIIGLVIGIAAVLLINPCKTSGGGSSTPPAGKDSLAQVKLNEQVGKYKELEAMHMSLIDRFLKLKEQNKPTGGQVGTGNPLAPTVVYLQSPCDNSTDSTGGSTPDSTRPSFKTYNYDLIMGAWITDDKITLLTFNPFVEATGGMMLKNYEFDRNTQNMEFASTTPSSVDALDGITFFDRRSFFRFDGVYAGAGYGVDIEFSPRKFGLLEVRSTFYDRLELSLQGNIEQATHGNREMEILNIGATKQMIDLQTKQEALIVPQEYRIVEIPLGSQSAFTVQRYEERTVTVKGKWYEPTKPETKQVWIDLNLNGEESEAPQPYESLEEARGVVERFIKGRTIHQILGVSK